MTTSNEIAGLQSWLGENAGYTGHGGADDSALYRQVIAAEKRLAELKAQERREDFLAVLARAEGGNDGDRRVLAVTSLWAEAQGDDESARVRTVVAAYKAAYGPAWAAFRRH